MRYVPPELKNTPSAYKICVSSWLERLKMRFLTEINVVYIYSEIIISRTKFQNSFC